MNFGNPKRLKRRGKLTTTYFSRVSAPGGKRTYRTTGTEDFREAQRIVARWRAETGPQALTLTTMQELIDQFLTSKKARIAETSYHLYCIQAEQLLDALGRDRKVEDIKHNDLERLLVQFVDGRSATTANNLRRFALGVFTWAIKRGFMSTNPAAQTEKFKETPKPIRALTSDELNRLLEAAKGFDKEVYHHLVVSAYSGLRKTTLESVNWTEVDLEAGVWNIPAQKMKARKPHCGIPMAEQVLEVLKERQALSNDPTERILRPLRRRDFGTVAALAGVKGASLHTLKKSFISTCARKGVPLELAMALTGNTNLKIVLEHYRAVREDELRSGLSKAFSPPTTGERSPSPVLQSGV